MNQLKKKNTTLEKLKKKNPDNVKIFLKKYASLYINTKYLSK